MYEIKDLLKKIINTGYKVKINHRVVNGQHILFFNYRKVEDGKMIQMSKRIAKLTGKNKREDIEIINEVIIERVEFEKNLEKEFEKPKDKNLSFLDFIDSHSDRYKIKGTGQNYKSMKKHIIAFSGEDTLLSDIDKQYCLKFMDFIVKAVPKSYSLYFTCFKSLINRAIDEELIQDATYLRKLNIKPYKSKRNYLTEAEIIAIYNLETEHENIKNAFIFSCYTGLRFSDLSALRFSDIIDNRVYIKQQKTGNVIALKLHKTALEIIEKQRIKQKDKVFKIPSYCCWNRKVKEIIKQVGITRHITGHCARHSFGTLCARKNINPLVIQQMMGHGDLKTTMEYINISGEQLDEAIDKLSN